jgi:hypothetical protein
MKLLDEVGCCHGHVDTGTVVDGAGAELPGIKMTGDNDDLLWVLTSFQVGYYIVGLGVRQHL